MWRDKFLCFVKRKKKGRKRSTIPFNHDCRLRSCTRNGQHHHKTAFSHENNHCMTLHFKNTHICLKNCQRNELEISNCRSFNIFVLSVTRAGLHCLGFPSSWIEPQRTMLEQHRFYNLIK